MRQAGVRPGNLFPLRSRSNPSASSLPFRAARRWWSQTGSNRRPHACKARALPTELWPLEGPFFSARERAVDLSARGVTRSVVGPGRLELPTSRLSGVCSNQLSYRPLKRSASGARPGIRDRTTASFGCGVLLERETETATSRYLFRCL